MFSETEGFPFPVFPVSILNLSLIDWYYYFKLPVEIAVKPVILKTKVKLVNVYYVNNFWETSLVYKFGWQSNGLVSASYFLNLGSHFTKEIIFIVKLYCV